MKIFLTLCLCFFMTGSVFAAQPSQWAEKEINSAAEIGIVNNEFNNYTRNITRGEFCTLCANTLKALKQIKPMLHLMM